VLPEYNPILGSQPRRAEEAGLRALLFHRHDRAAGDPPRAAIRTSWKSEVVADKGGEFCGDTLRFATSAEAGAHVLDLSSA